MKFKLFVLLFITFNILSIFIIFFYPSDPMDYYPKTIVIEKGDTVRDVAFALKAENIIGSTIVFISASYLVGGGKVLFGSHVFDKPKGTLLRAIELKTGSKSMDVQKITILRGENVYQIADKFKKHFKEFDTIYFTQLGLQNHGFLYPDTYHFSKLLTPTAESIIEIMKRTFTIKTEEVFKQNKTRYSKEELVILASIVELESFKPEDQKKIASVLFNRLEKNIPLQVDVSFLFINDSLNKERTYFDLKIDNRQNTYLYKGIPTIAIGNPSVNTIRFVVNPIKTDYYYFLADNTNVTHFSKTFEEHKQKVKKYLRK